MIYDKNETQLYSVYDVNGNDLNIAYDINENTVYPSSPITPTIKVMTYNYQWCYNFNSQLAMQQAIIDKYKPDIIGLQEACTRQDVINKVTVGSFPNIALQFLSDYDYKYLSTMATNKNGMASKLPMSNYQNIRYTQYDDEYWDYQKCYITLPSGKTIAWYNTHLTWRTDSATLLRKYAQAQEFFADVSQEDYAIITGDFNMYGLAFDSADYIGIGKQFADAGYKLSNWNRSAGFVKTWTDSATETSLANFTYATDNIIVTPNINIVDVTFDTTKFSYLNGQSIDHIPIVVGLLIN